MTPEQRAVLQRMQAMYDDFGALLNDVRAVLRERDAEWQEAAQPAMELLMMFPADAMGFLRAGQVASALRALLEEAGK